MIVKKTAKTFIVVSDGCHAEYVEYQDAEDQAKRYVNSSDRCHDGTYIVYEAIAAIKSPVPEAEVTKL